MRVLCARETLTSVPSKVLPHTSSPQLVVWATPFMLVVVEAPKPLEDVMAIVGPGTRVSKSTFPLSFGTPSEEVFT